MFAEVSTASRLRPGTKLGRYEIQRFIAEGGMGELYVARASGIEGFQKTVAVKRILARFASRDEHVRMFLDEARVAATLHHPHIVSVFDIGDEAGVLFFSMEYVHGTDVRALLQAAHAKGQPVPLGAALEIAISTAAGLHHAHQAGIVHRDVSPSNVLLAHDGGVKVTDFGVAKVAERTAETRPGMLKGKVAYMSPEQCRGEEIDRRSDVFAIGILLYELTCGEKPFQGTSDFAVMEQIVHRDARPPSSIRAGYPPELETIVMRALRRDLEQRCPTAQELQRELRQLARDRKLDVSPLALEGYLRELFGEQVDTWRREEVESSRVAAPPTAVTVREGRAGAPPPRPLPPRRRWLPIALGLGAAGIAGTLVIARRGGGRAQAAPPTAEVAPVEAAPPPPAPAPATEVGTPPAATPPAATATRSDAPSKSDAPRKRPRVEKPGARRAPSPPAAEPQLGEEVADPPPATPPPPPPPPPATPERAQAQDEPRRPVPQPAKPAVREVPWDPDSPTFPGSK